LDSVGLFASTRSQYFILSITDIMGIKGLAKLLSDEAPDVSVVSFVDHHFVVAPQRPRHLMP
jgi:hypothetical protein